MSMKESLAEVTMTLSFYKMITSSLRSMSMKFITMSIFLTGPCKTSSTSKKKRRFTNTRHLVRASIISVGVTLCLLMSGVRSFTHKMTLSMINIIMNKYSNLSFTIPLKRRSLIN